MKASSFAILSLSLFLLAAVPAMASEDGDATEDTEKTLIWFIYREGGCAYEIDSPVHIVTFLGSEPAGVIGWVTEDGREIALGTELDPPLTGNVVKLLAVYAETTPEKTPAFGNNGGSMLYLGLGMVIIIAMLAYIIVVRMDLAKVCRKK